MILGNRVLSNLQLDVVLATVPSSFILYYVDSWHVFLNDIYPTYLPYQTAKRIDEIATPLFWDGS